MATAGKLVIVEAEEIVEPGVIPPNEVHTPGVYVHRVFKSEPYEKRIEKVVNDKSDQPPIPESEKSRSQKIREKIIKRCAKEVNDGMYVNLGIGIPTLLPAHLE